MTLSGSVGRAFAAIAFSIALGVGMSGSAEAATVVIQKTTIYINTLPKGCVKTTYSGGVVVWRCGKLYYQPYNGRYVRVYVKT